MTEMLLIMDEHKPENHFFTLEGVELALCDNRYDERQRAMRYVLPSNPTSRDFAPLFDVMHREHGFADYHFTGKTVKEWIDALRARQSPDLARFMRWYMQFIDQHMAFLRKRRNVPENHFAVEMVQLPVVSSLPGMISRLGMKRASAEHWAEALRALRQRGLRQEELEQSGILTRLETLYAGLSLSLTELLALIDVRPILPRLVCESYFGFVTQAGWESCCRRIAAKEYAKCGLLGYRGSDSLYVIRYQHRALGWKVVRCRHHDLVTTRSDWWAVLDEKGRRVQQPLDGFQSPEAAFLHAEGLINRRFAQLGQAQALPKWRQYSLPGGQAYSEVLIQLHDWPHSYHPRHFRTRNVLVHIRTSIRRTEDGRRLLFLDEIQSDWHADLHAAEKCGLESDGPAPAPYRKEWPSLALKLMLAWSQRQGLEGVAWSTPEMQLARWGKYGPPEALYRSVLPEAAEALARMLNISHDFARMTLRCGSKTVQYRDDGWLVCNREGVSVTKPFYRREQAEHFADLTCVQQAIDVPVLWISGLRPIRQIPLYGLATSTFWCSDK